MATSPIYSWPEPDNTDLVKNGALAIRTLGNAIDTTMATMTPKSLVDAKGDLIAATANDTPARLAVGSNGETLVADSSTATGLRYQEPLNLNPVLNSGFDIWQRGTSSTAIGSGTFLADRWQAARAGFAAGASQSRQVTGDTTNLPNIQYCARVQRDSGNTSTATIYLGQNLESVNSIPYVGKTVTLSFYARKGANFSQTSSSIDSAFASGTGTDQNIVTSGTLTGINNTITTHTLTTTWQRFTVTKTIDATATQLALEFYYAPTGTAGAADYFEVTGVMINVGSVAYPFRRTTGTIQGELAACERYFQIVTGQMVSGANTTIVYGGVNFRTQMRTAPSVALSAAMTITDAGADYSQSSASVSIVSSRANSTGAQIQMPNFTSITTHRPYTTTITASQIQFSAEL